MNSVDWFGSIINEANQLALSSDATDEMEALESTYSLCYSDMLQTVSIVREVKTSRAYIDLSALIQNEV